MLNWNPQVGGMWWPWLYGSLFYIY
jgi:hypothetical protein